MIESDLSGISVTQTDKGFLLRLQGELYRKIGERISKGESTKEFYHHLRIFIKSISQLAE